MVLLLRVLLAVVFMLILDSGVLLVCGCGGIGGRSVVVGVVADIEYDITVDAVDVVADVGVGVV